MEIDRSRRFSFWRRAENVRSLIPKQRRNTSTLPVLHPLHPIASVIAQLPGNFGSAAERFNQPGIGVLGWGWPVHAAIKQYVRKNVKRIV